MPAPARQEKGLHGPTTMYVQQQLGEMETSRPGTSFTDNDPRTLFVTQMSQHLASVIYDCPSSRPSRQVCEWRDFD